MQVIEMYGTFIVSDEQALCLKDPYNGSSTCAKHHVGHTEVPTEIKLTSHTKAASERTLQLTHCSTDGWYGGTVQIATFPLESHDESRG